MPIDPRAVEQSRARANVALAAHARTLASGRQCASLDVGGGGAVFTWPGAPFNEAVGLGFSDDAPEETLSSVEAFFAAHGEAARIALADCVPALWRALSFARGYGLRDLLYVWQRPLDDEDPARAAIDGRVERVEARDSELWARTVAVGFAEAAPLADRDMDLARAIAGTPDIALFVARHEGRPAAAGAVVAAGDTARVFSGATLPHARRARLQAALIRARLAYAQGRGGRVAVVQTDPAGASRRNVERAGFTLAYTVVQFQART